MIVPARLPRLCLLAAAALGCAAAAQKQIPADAPYKQAALPIEDRVRDLLARMSVQEKARQLDMYRGVSPSTREDAQQAADELKTRSSHEAAMNGAQSRLL